MSMGQMGHTPRGVPPKFFMFIGFSSPNFEYPALRNGYVSNSTHLKSASETASVMNIDPTKKRSL